MAVLNIPYTFIPGTPALASEVNANFQAVKNWSQGLIGTDNITVLTARTAALPLAPTSAILYFNQTTSNNAIYIANTGTKSPIEITQSGSIGNGSANILITNLTTQSTIGAAELRMQLAANSSIPALWIQHGAVDTLSLTRTHLRLEALLRPPVRSTAQRDAIASPDQGSILYNQTTQTVDVKNADKWVPIGVPTGSVQMYAGNSQPDGWLFCNGQDVLQSQYPQLYALIGTTYGSSPNPVTHFKLPNFVAAFPRGAQMGGTVSQTIQAKSFGANINGSTRKDTTAVNGLSATQAPHSHGGTMQVTSQDPSSDGGSGYTEINYNYNRSTDSQQPTITVASTDSETTPANLSICFIIKY